MDTAYQAWDVIVDGNYAYVADRTSGLAIIDVSNPASPGTPSYVPLNYQGATGYSEDVDIVDNYAYVAVDPIGLAVFPLNTSSIQDASGNNVTLTLPSPGATNSLGANKAIVINDNDGDGVKPYARH